MAEWIEVPAHRVLRVDSLEYKRDFREVDENGQEPGFIYRIIRIKDAKVFRVPRYHAFKEDCNAVVFLEEV